MECPACSNHSSSMQKPGSRRRKYTVHFASVTACSGQSLQQLTTGHWFRIAKGHFLYKPATCILRRMSGEDARRCLAGKHVALVGDSLMRYHYVAFAHLLSKLRRMEPYGGRPGHSALCIVTEWKTWNQFFHFSSAILGTSARGCGAELCDCWRDDTAGSEFREHRTLQVFNQPDSLTAGLDALKYYEHSYRQQPHDVIIINMGLHIEEEFFTVAPSVINAGEAFKRKHNTTMLWKTTTHGISGAWDERAEESELIAAHKAYAAYDVGKMVLAAKEQRVNLCWDGVHFLPFVYEQFNDVLPYYMCE